MNLWRKVIFIEGMRIEQCGSILFMQILIGYVLNFEQGKVTKENIKYVLWFI